MRTKKSTTEQAKNSEQDRIKNSEQENSLISQSNGVSEITEENSEPYFNNSTSGENSEQSRIKNSERKKSKKSEAIILCDLCQQEISESPNMIHLPSLTSCAGWYRNCKKDRLNICNKCAKKFNKLIDDYVCKQNSELIKDYAR